MRLFSALFLAFFNTIFLTSALLIYLPFEKGGMLIWSGLLTPFLWVALIFFAYWPQRARPMFTTMFSLMVCSGSLVALSWVLE